MSLELISPGHDGENFFFANLDPEHGSWVSNMKKESAQKYKYSGAS
jgi:hypothetical protein